MRRLARLIFTPDTLQPAPQGGYIVPLPEALRPVGLFVGAEGRHDIIVESGADNLPTALSPWVAQTRRISYEVGQDGISLQASIDGGAFTPTSLWLTREIPELLPIAQVHVIARLCHEINREWCEVNDDLSQRPWEASEGWQTKSAVMGVMWRLEHPDAPASAQHDAWVADKASQGWVYGDEKDPAARRHPCMVAYTDLSIVQRMKDALFGTTVRVMADQFRRDARSTRT